MIPAKYNKIDNIKIVFYIKFKKVNYCSNLHVGLIVGAGLKPAPTTKKRTLKKKEAGWLCSHG